MKKIGRNAPCPCGSGRKYKKCCLGKSDLMVNSEPVRDNSILPPYKKINYGTPVLDNLFFESNNVHEISAPRLVYSFMINPGVEELASTFTNQVLDRGKAEREIIENTDSIHDLIDMMNNEIDPLNHMLLQTKIVQQKEKAVPILIDGLKKPKNDSFVELAVKIIHETQIDCSRELIDILCKHPLNGYSTSLICMLLGFYNVPEAEKILWNYYHYLKEHFPNETFSDGPLIGLSEMREQKKELLAAELSKKIEQ